MAANRRTHLAEVLIDKGSQFLRTQAFRNRSKANDIRKQHSELRFLGNHVVLQWVFSHFLDELGWYIATK